MKCPNCGARFDDNCRFCGACGTALVPEKRGGHLVPILLMLALTIAGLCIYFICGSPAEPEVSVPTFDSSWFTADNGNLKFDKFAYNGSGQLSVPPFIEGEAVIWVDDRCFEDCDVLTEVFLPGTVEHIGTAAFADCDSLMAIDLPDSLITIGGGAFRSCDSLEAVHVPDSVNFIATDAFDNCGALSYVFYDGTWAGWNAIFGSELAPGVTICCADGNYSVTE